MCIIIQDVSSRMIRQRYWTNHLIVVKHFPLTIRLNYNWLMQNRKIQFMRYSYLHWWCAIADRFVCRHTRMYCILWFLQGHFMRADMKYTNAKNVVCAAVLPVLWQVIILCAFKEDLLDSIVRREINPFWCIWI